MTLTACSEEEMMTSNDAVYSGKMKIVVEKTQAATRVAYDGLSAEFESGDALGLYAVDASGTARFSNVQVTYNGTSWTLSQDVTYNPDWSYYAYYPYRSDHGYTPDFSKSTVDAKFSAFIDDAGTKFHNTDQSTKAAFNASDLMIAQGTVSGTNTVRFVMNHKKALAYLTISLPEDALPFLPFTDNIPYIVGNKGYFCMKPNQSTTIAGYSLSAASGKYVQCAISDIDTSNSYLTFYVHTSSYFKFSNAINYSLDGGKTWTSLAANTYTPIVNGGKKIMWKADLSPEANKGIGTFSATRDFSVGGNIMSLLYGDEFKGKTDLTGKDYTFYNLFYNNAWLINAEYLSLPATTLAQSCYNSMFLQCTALTTAPELPATTLAQSCYGSMFSRCTALTTAPSILPATTLATQCCYGMFRYCYKLTTAPAELPATTLADQCYREMFSGCTSLTTAPELPATILADQCYSNMFQNCTSLTTAPAILPATTLADQCYSNMFLQCTALTTAPKLPATTLASQCYKEMFRDCTSLTTAPAILPATTLINGCCYRMFQNCTSLTTAPELPATTLSDQCYREMFRDCTSLTTAPELPARTLAGYCYYSMFSGCTNLNYIKMMATNISAFYCINDWVYGVASSGTFVKNSDATWTKTGTSGIPENWTVQTASE